MSYKEEAPKNQVTSSPNITPFSRLV